MRKRIVVGSRGSRLAQLQAQSVLAELTSIYPGLDFSLVKVVTKGDRGKAPFKPFLGTGVFVKELQEALLKGEIDIAIHSLKDLPLKSPEGLLVAAVTSRLDPRDVFISRGSRLAELSSGSLIGTASPRRTFQLLSYRPDLKVEPIRGNIDTRVRRVMDGEYDGIIVAAAAIIRLGWQDRITEYLPLEHFLPQAGQGALGVEIRAGDEEMEKLVKPLHHEPTAQSIGAERALLQALGGGCSEAIGALGTVSGARLKLQGMVVRKGKAIYESEEGSALEFEKVALKLAEKFKAKADEG